MSQFPPNPPGPPGPTPPPQQPGWQGGPPPQQGGYPPNVPPAQWPQQGGPPSGGGSKTGLFVVVGLLVLAAVGGALFLITSGDDESGGGGSGGGGSSPKDAVQSFWQATQDKDCNALLNLITEESWGYIMMGDDVDITAEPPAISREDALAECQDQAENDPEFTEGGELVDTEVTAEDGNTATVSVTTDEDGSETTIEMPVVNENGSWKLDFAAMFSGLGDIPEIDEGDLDTEFTIPEDFETDFTIPED